MKKLTNLLIILYIAISANAQTYDPLAVQRINDLIENNGLDATPDAPETWTFAIWNNEEPKQIRDLHLDNRNLTGAVSFEGLSTLELLFIFENFLTELNVSNCINLEMLRCYANNLTALDLSNCTELFSLNCCKNQLINLNLNTNLKLVGLTCHENNLTELVVRS